MTRSRITAIAFLILIVSSLSGMFLFASQTTESMPNPGLGNRLTVSDLPLIYHAGKVESIEVVEFQSIEEALTALDNGEADIYGHPINSSDYALVDSYDNIEKQWAYDNRMYTLALNTEFYPLGNHYLRRAIAFAISKLDIAQQAMNGTVSPVDFAVGLNNEYSIEAEEGGVFYDSDIANGTDMLGLAGMLDVDSDGVVEAPNGSEICLKLWYPEDLEGLSETASMISDDLLAIGINNTLIGLNYSDLQWEVANHNLTYNLALYHQELPIYSLEWLSTTFRSGNTGVEGENIANMQDDELDAIANEYEGNVNLDQVVSIGREAMRTIRDLCPVVPVFQEQWLSVYSKNNFIGWLNETNGGSFSIWNPISIEPIGEQTQLKVAVLPSFFDDFFQSLNPLEANMTLNHNWIARERFNPYMLLFDSPIATLPNGKAVPRHSTSWDTLFSDQARGIEKGQSRSSFDLDPSANWSDGEPMSSEDYRFTFLYYSEYSLIEEPDLIDGAIATGDYQAGVDLNTHDIFMYRIIGELPILPSHSIEGKKPNEWNVSKESLVTSGPYFVSDFVLGESLTLERNPSYYPEVDDEPPTLNSKSINPENPLPTESVAIRVTVNDKSRIDNVTLEYTYEVGNLNFTESQVMIETAIGYEGTIPARATATTIFYKITATDTWGNSGVVLEGSYSRITDDDNDLYGIVFVGMGVAGIILLASLVIILRRGQ